MYPEAITQIVESTIKYKLISNNTYFKDFSGEKIKIEAKYWAITIKTILYPLTTEK